nr:hypothetical protein [Streptomyces zagrosensis]
MTHPSAHPPTHQAPHAPQQPAPHPAPGGYPQPSGYAQPSDYAANDGHAQQWQQPAQQGTDGGAWQQQPYGAGAYDQGEGQRGGHGTGHNAYGTEPYGSGAYGSAAQRDPAYGDPAYGDPAYADAARRDPAYGTAPYGNAPRPQAPYGHAAHGEATRAHAAPAPHAGAHTHAQTHAETHVGDGNGNGAGPEEGDSEVSDVPLTAAERARAEGRPQILGPGLQPALLTAVLAGLLAITAPLAEPALAVAVVLLQAVTAAGWFRLNGMWPARQGIALAFLAGVAADIGLLVTDHDQASTVLLGTLGGWLLLVIVLQLRNLSPPDERLYGLTATATSAALAVVAAGHLATAADPVVIGAAGVGVAALVRALPLPGIVSVVLALGASAGAGFAAGQATDFGAVGAVLGLAAGACALIGLRVASYDYPSRFVHLTAGVALPLTAAAPAVYVLGRALS